MVLRCKECGEIIEVRESELVGGQVVQGYRRAKVPVCPDCAAWAWELCGEGDEEGAV